jgi:hypothetical protein
MGARLRPLVLRRELAALAHEDDALCLGIVPRDAPVCRVYQLLAALVGRMRERLYVRVEVGVEPVAGRAADEGLQVLVLIQYYLYILLNIL